MRQMKNYPKDKSGNLVLPQGEWPTLSAQDLKLRQLLAAAHQAQDVYQYSSRSERSAAFAALASAQAAYNAELQRAVLTH
jgi:hypothetical protein